VPKVVGDVAASGAASLGLGTLLGALGPAYTVYGVLDALGFFDKSMEATPMTPEEAAEYEATSRLALAQSGMQEGGEGAYETLMDAVSQAAQTGLLSNEDIGVSGKWYDPETGEELPDFDPKTGKGMGTLFPIFQPDPVSTAGGGGGGGDTAASAASSEAASAASSQADSGIGDWVYDADAGVFRQSGGIETFTPVPGTYTAGQTISNADAEAVFGEWGDISEENTATTPTDTTTTTANSGASTTGLGLPNILYLPDFGGADGTGTLTLPTFTAGTGTTGTGTTGTGTTGTGTTGTGTTGTGTTGTGTTGAGTANLGGTGGGLSTGTGTGDGSGTGSGTGTGEGAGDGSGTGDGVGDGTGDGTGGRGGDAEEAASLINQGVRGMATEQAGVADISMLYDPSLSLAENMARILGKGKNKQADAVDSALMYGGGIVQTTDLNDELLRIIGGR
jgi:hypothetical protein